MRDALSNLLTYGSNGNQVTAKDQAAAKASYAALQQEIMADYADMKAAVAAADACKSKQTPDKKIIVRANTDGGSLCITVDNIFSYLWPDG